MHLFKKSRINNPSKNTVTNFCHFIGVLRSFCIKNQSFILSYPHNPKHDQFRLECGYLFFFISHLCVFDAFLTYILYKNTLFDAIFFIFPFNFLVIPLFHVKHLLLYFLVQLFHVKHYFYLVLLYNCST